MFWEKIFIYLANKHFFDLMDDKKYLEIYWYCLFNYKLNLKNPKSFNEKIQWLKLYDRKPEYSIMVDKYETKKYVAKIIGEKYIIPTLGVWDKFDDINFSNLPEQFVLKSTHDSGGIIICRDKTKFDINKAKKKIKKNLKTNYYFGGREWPYKNVKPRIIAEPYMDDGCDGLRDYKFFNFNGESKFMYISEGLENHSTAKLSFFDFEGHKLPFNRRDFKQFDGDCDLPLNFTQMREVSDLLSKEINCPFVRTDFYSINNKIYFSEITFSPCSGMIPFDPTNWDIELGKWIKLPLECGEE